MKSPLVICCMQVQSAPPHYHILMLKKLGEIYFSSRTHPRIHARMHFSQLSFCFQYRRRRSIFYVLAHTPTHAVYMYVCVLYANIHGASFAQIKSTSPSGSAVCQINTSPPLDNLFTQLLEESSTYLLFQQNCDWMSK